MNWEGQSILDVALEHHPEQRHRFCASHPQRDAKTHRHRRPGNRHRESVRKRAIMEDIYVAEQEKSLKSLLKGLNEDLAGEYNAIISYLQYSAKVKGPYRPQLVGFLQAEIPDEQAHAQYLADKIVSLGGEPVVEPKPVKTSNDTREMLQFIYEAEAATVENYKKRLEQAEAFGDVGLQSQIEDMIADETTHRDEVKKMLDGWH
jgi:bacterioferritin